MSKILKNNTGSNVFIADVGQTVPASGQLTIDPSDYDKYAQSSDVIVFIANATLTVNDGSFDLTISNGLDLIKGIFPQSLIVKGAVDDVSTVSAAEGDFESIRMTQYRAMHTNLRNVSGAEIGTASIPMRIDPTGTTPQPVTGNVSQAVDQYSNYSPNPINYVSSEAGGTPAVDVAQNLITRSTVLTDEGTFRDDFSGSGLTTALTGTLTFTNNSRIVTGAGTLFTTEILRELYIKKTADSETLYAQVQEIISDTSLLLAIPYTGTTASSTAVKSNWKTGITGGASITVSTSLLNLISSTASGNIARVERRCDYMPCNMLIRASVSQRIANQTIVFGLQDSISSPSQQAVFVLDGALNTTVKVRSSFSAAVDDIQETTVTLGTSLATNQTLLYQIDVTSNQVSFLVNDVIVAVHKIHIPSPYTVLSAVASISNAAVVTTTTASFDFIYFSNVNQVQISNDFTGEPQKVQLMGKSVVNGLPVDLALDQNGNLIVTALTGFNSDFSFGDVTLAAIALAVVRRTAYVEQTTNAQRSLVSSSASDAAAGTGARTVIITYYTDTFTGPFTETVTLNGTTAVNTVATNICYIESMNVITAGSTGSNVGIISLRAATGGGGATIGTIAATNNQTFWAHHYVPTGKVCNITGISCNHNGTTVGSGGVFILRAQPLGVANAIENQVTDFIRLYGQSSTSTRTYTSPIKVNGPARIVCYVTPETASSTVYRAAFDFFEP